MNIKKQTLLVVLVSSFCITQAEDTTDNTDNFARLSAQVTANVNVSNMSSTIEEEFWSHRIQSATLFIPVLFASIKASYTLNEQRREVNSNICKGLENFCHNPSTQSFVALLTTFRQLISEPLADLTAEEFKARHPHSLISEHLQAAITNYKTQAALEEQNISEKIQPFVQQLQSIFPQNSFHELGNALQTWRESDFSKDGLNRIEDAVTNLSCQKNIQALASLIANRYSLN